MKQRAHLRSYSGKTHPRAWLWGSCRVECVGARWGTILRRLSRLQCLRAWGQVGFSHPKESARGVEDLSGLLFLPCWGDGEPAPIPEDHHSGYLVSPDLISLALRTRGATGTWSRLGAPFRAWLKSTGTTRR